MENVAIERMCDIDDIQRPVETLQKIIAKFREVDIRKKLKDYQKIKIGAYNHCLTVCITYMLIRFGINTIMEQLCVVQS